MRTAFAITGALLGAASFAVHAHVPSRLGDERIVAAMPTVRWTEPVRTSVERALEPRTATPFRSHRARREPMRAPYSRPDVLGRADGEREVVATARSIEAAWEAGDGARADALLAAPDSVVAWDQVGPGVRLEVAFPGDSLELRVSRAEAGPAMAVAFPPGAYGDFGGGRYQDLTMLRAPVLVVREGETAARLEVPIACASFRRHCAPHGSPCALRRFPAGSVEERLVARLCMGAEPPLDAAAQLAMWTVTQDGLTSLSELDGSITFGTNEQVDATSAEAASALITEAGLRPTDFATFAGEPAATP